MGKIILRDKKVETPDGKPIKEACKSLGIPFSCEDGVCGTCLVDVGAGAENLEELNDAEKIFGLTDKNKRLCCQARMKSGDVVIESFF
tara:strand:- start:5382 stop:5645 length:264 start_codon:yes stop_codon:yes gene_type:complete